MCNDKGLGAGARAVGLGIDLGQQELRAFVPGARGRTWGRGQRDRRSFPWDFQFAGRVAFAVVDRPSPEFPKRRNWGRGCAV